MAAEQHAYFTFGRFQPPTRGHKAMVAAMVKDAAAANAAVYVFVSSSCDLKGNVPPSECTNPLTVEERIAIMEKQYKNFNPMPRIINTSEVAVYNPLKAATYLLNEGYNKVKIYAGHDREEGYKKVAKKYFEGKMNVKGLNRNKTKVGNKGVSGTQMRKAALNNNMATFRAGIKTAEITTPNLINLAAKIKASNAARRTEAAKPKGSRKRALNEPNGAGAAAGAGGSSSRAKLTRKATSPKKAENK